MFYLVDTNPGSVLMAADCWRNTSLDRDDLYVKGEAENFQKFDAIPKVIDVSQAMVEGDDVLEDVVEEWIAEAGSTDLVVTVSQVPPWEQKQTDSYLNTLERAIGTATSLKERFGIDFQIYWYAPPGHETISRILAKYKGLVTQRENPYYQRLTDPDWIQPNRETLDLMSEALFQHSITPRANSEILSNLISNLAQDPSVTKASRSQEYLLEGLVGSSGKIKALRANLIKAAKAGPGLNVMLVGETGTGKEASAQAIRQQSALREKPFEAMNCSGMNEHLAEAFLFGYAKGAFTSAVGSSNGLLGNIDSNFRSPGHQKKQFAGTLFLDELHDLPQPTQGLLLRFLETGEYRRVGDTEIRHAKIRIISALQPNKMGQVRQDLINRLGEFVINLPPLNDRRQDIRQVARHLLEEMARECPPPTCYLEGKNRPLDQSRIDEVLCNGKFFNALGRHDWSRGNVRDLRSALKRAALLGCFDLPEPEPINETVETTKNSPANTEGEEQPSKSGSLLEFPLPDDIRDILTAEEVRAAYVKTVNDKWTEAGTKSAVILKQLGIKDPRTLGKILRSAALRPTIKGTRGH